MIKTIVKCSLIFLILGIFLSKKSNEVKDFLMFFLRKQSPSSLSSIRVFTKNELKLYNGIDKPELFLSLLGIVFNVTKGMKHYGPNQQYNIFVGRDASRSFITGQFDLKDIREDVADLSQQELLSLNNWMAFYKKDYQKVGVIMGECEIEVFFSALQRQLHLPLIMPVAEAGKLIGKYFDENGKSTDYRNVVMNLIKEAELARDRENLDKIKFPPCNIEWDPETGTTVWCTEKSGGVIRDWIGVPRQLYEPGSQTYRCACINEDNEKLGNIKEYEGCEERSHKCLVKM